MRTVDMDGKKVRLQIVRKSYTYFSSVYVKADMPWLGGSGFVKVGHGWCVHVTACVFIFFRAD
jgi:hypothetical protein